MHRRHQAALIRALSALFQVAGCGRAPSDAILEAYAHGRSTRERMWRLLSVPWPALRAAAVAGEYRDVKNTLSDTPMRGEPDAP